MAGTKKPRKAYRSKPRLKHGGLDVIARRITQGSPLLEEECVNVLTDYYEAITAMMAGRADQGHFDTLVYAVNIGRVLSDNGIGTEFEHLIDPAMGAMKRCKERMLRTKRIGLDADGIAALRDFGPLHEAQMETATAGEISAAITEMHRRIAAGLEYVEKEVA